MKLKTFLAATLLVVGALGQLRAQQSLDITDLYITNPGFELGNTNGWTVGSSSDTGARSTTNDTYKMSNSEGSYLFNTWWQGIPITQTISSLPAGSYTLSAVLASDGATIYLIAGDDTDSYAYTETTNSGVGIVVSKDFTLTEATDFKIGAVGGADGTAGEHKDYTAAGYWWYKADNFKLILNLENDATIPDAIVTKLLTSVPSGTMSTSVKSALDTAVSTFESNATLDNYNALLTAISAANTSIASYAAISAGTISTSELGKWAISTTNGALACNTWSVEGNSDGSSMTTPFIQDWVGSGTPLTGGSAAGKLYYTLEGLNPGEKYNVSALVRVFNESAGDLGGASFYANSVSVDVDENGTTCSGDYSTKGIYGTFNAKAVEVDENGKLEFGIALESTSALNWIAIKNVTISEYAGQAVESITLSQSSATLTTGDALTLTATVSPDDADDKTVTWTSSNPAVATVTSGGIVTALAAGSAIITCTANDGSEVNSSCSLTVADATAPSYYSETIAEGDYYIMNAATGTFLGGSNSWGTQASVIEHGILFSVAVGEGTYTLDSHTYNKETQHFLNGTYVDGDATNLYITSLGSGKFSISTADGSAFVTAIAGSTVVNNTAANTNSPLAQWYFLSKNDRDKMLASATAVNPVDATYYVKQANISRNLSAGAHDENAWSQYSVGGTQNNSNFAAQVYNAAVDNYQTIENIPNGTYVVSVQAFTSGTDVKFYANDQKVDVLAKPDGVATPSAASALFAAKSYTNTVTVTVTDRTLKIGFEGDCSGSKWLCYDDVTLYMTGYTANTGVLADDVALQIGQNVAIGATTDPATASFNKLTYASADESIATVNENGTVTGVAVGNTTITITANEMENFSKTINVAVTFIPATSEDYAALNAAIEAAEAKTLGFDKDEYAPYNNAAAVALLAAAKAIDQDAENTQEDVQAATTALTGAEWIQNATEVNAVYDGTFAAATNDGAPAGWRMSNNTLGGSYHSRAFVGDERLAEFNETNSGLFIRFDGTNSSRGSMYYYGDTENYTMPLKAGVTYYVKVDFAGWGSTGKPLRMNITGPTGFDAKNQQYNTSVRADNADNTPQQFLVVFTATVDGNYVINFQTPGADTNTHNVVISNVELKRATPATMKITDAQYATFVAPFAVTIPDGVTATTVESVSGNTLVMEEVTTTIPANTPVVLFKEEALDATTFYGYPIEGTPTEGLLTGVYAETTATAGTYVLQNNDEKVGFYQVVADQEPTIGANRAYLTLPTPGVKAYFFDKETGINSVLNEIAAGNIYDLSGRKVAKMQKGQTYIVGDKKVTIR